MATVSEVSKFFEHGKRQDKLLESKLPEAKRSVRPLCRTRWVEWHDALENCIQ